MSYIERICALDDADRDIAHLQGLVMGIMADGVLQDAEISFLHQWFLNLHNHSGCNGFTNLEFILADAVADALEDGVITQEERLKLLQLFKKYVGEDETNVGIVEAKPCLLPIHEDAVITHEGQTFVFTGVFTYGERKECHEKASSLGAKVVTGISPKVTFLVVADSASPHWIHTNYGRKIQKALDLNKGGRARIKIVTEKMWVDTHEKEEEALFAKMADSLQAYQNRKVLSD
jgi:NAD-dependent DNA ligase